MKRKSTEKKDKVVGFRTLRVEELRAVKGGLSSPVPRKDDHRD